MRKQILTLGAICAAAFTLTNCNKEIVEPQAPVTGGTDFEIIANTADTKTANNGLNTVWVAGDALAVFHAEAGSTTYGSNDEFTYSGADNKFTGKLATGLDASKSYDWYAMFPYSSYIKTPTNSDKGGYVYIGDRSDQSQIQTGNDSKAHLMYSASNQTGLRNCPLYAVAKGVAASATPTFTMKQLASIVEVNVTNTNTAPLTVSTVSFTAPAGTNIVGTFYVNFTDNGDAVYTDGQYPGNTANLTVKSGTAIAKDGVAKFYLAIKPFAANTGDELKISVNGYEKTHKLTKNVEFKAGKIEAVNFKYNNSTVTAAPYYKADFEGATEHRASGTSNDYTKKNTYTVSGVKWELMYADAVTTGTPLSGKANIMCRIAKDKTYKPYILSENLLSKAETVTKVSFLSKLGTKASLIASYSVDGGSTWNQLTVNKDKSVHATLGYSASLTGVTASDFRLKFEWSRTGTAKVDSQIDDICVFTE